MANEDGDEPASPNPAAVVDRLMLRLVSEPAIIGRENMMAKLMNVVDKRERERNREECEVNLRVGRDDKSTNESATTAKSAIFIAVIQNHLPRNTCIIPLDNMIADLRIERNIEAKET
jgi:hypothetical protein